MAKVICDPQQQPRLSYTDLQKYFSSRLPQIRENYEFDREGLDESYVNLEAELPFAVVLAQGLTHMDLELGGQITPIAVDFMRGNAAKEFFFEYRSYTVRLGFPGAASPSLIGNAFAIADCLAAGRFSNAQILHDQAVRLLEQRAYNAQGLYAEDLERKKDPSNYVEIIPQRLFVFVHELMGQRAGQDKQPWAKWDIVGDKEYIDAARAVYTDDPDLAAATLCKLCNLHVQYSNPFPEGDNDDHLVGIEFDTPIRSLWPTEIFAWLRLRQERGLPLPDVEHPLLDQPLGHFDPEVARNWQPEPWFVEFVDKLAQFDPRYKDLPDMIFGSP